MRRQTFAKKLAATGVHIATGLCIGNISLLHGGIVTLDVDSTASYQDAVAQVNAAPSVTHVLSFVQSFAANADLSTFTAGNLLQIRSDVDETARVLESVNFSTLRLDYSLVPEPLALFINAVQYLGGPEISITGANVTVNQLSALQAEILTLQNATISFVNDPSHAVSTFGESDFEVRSANNTTAVTGFVFTAPHSSKSITGAWTLAPTADETVRLAIDVTQAESSLELSGQILEGDGEGSLSKSGPGTLILSNENQFNGFLLQEGTLRLTDSLAMGFGALITDGEAAKTWELVGTLTLDNAIEANADLTVKVDADSAVLDGKISGSGALTKVGGGALHLSADNDFTGGIKLVEGKLVAASSDQALGVGELTISGDTTLELRDSISIENAITFEAGNTPATITVDQAADEVTLLGLLKSQPSDANATTLAFNKAGAGQLNIGKDNTDLAGTITIAEGVISMQDVQAGLGKADITIQQGGSLAFADVQAPDTIFKFVNALTLDGTGAPDATIAPSENAPVQLSGVISGSSALYIMGNAVPTEDNLLVSLTNTENAYAGGTIVDSAQLEATKGTLPGTALALTNQAVFRWGDAFVLNGVTVSGLADDDIFMDLNGLNVVAPDFGDDIAAIRHNDNSGKGGYMTFWQSISPDVLESTPHFVDASGPTIELLDEQVLAFVKGATNSPSGFDRSVTGGTIETISESPTNFYILTILPGATLESNLKISGAAQIVFNTDVKDLQKIIVSDSVFGAGVLENVEVLAQELELDAGAMGLISHGKLTCESVTMNDRAAVVMGFGQSHLKSIVATTNIQDDSVAILALHQGKLDIDTLTVQGTGTLLLGVEEISSTDSGYLKVGDVTVAGNNSDAPNLQLRNTTQLEVFELANVNLLGHGKLQKLGEGPAKMQQLSTSVASDFHVLAGTLSITDALNSNGKVMIDSQGELSCNNATIAGGSFSVNGILDAGVLLNLKSGVLQLIKNGYIKTNKLKIAAGGSCSYRLEDANAPVTTAFVGAHVMKHALLAMGGFVGDLSAAPMGLLDSPPLNGAIDGDVEHDGLLETAGPLHITGNLTQTHTAITSVLVSPDIVGTITVGGTASLAGVLQINAEGCAGPADLPKIPILLADGGISGSFVGTVFEPEACTSAFKLFQTSTGIFLINMAAVDFAKNACTCPQQCMLQALTDYYVEQTPGIMLDFIEDVIIPIQNPECCIWETLMGEAYADLLPMGIYSARLTTSSIQKQLWRAHDLWLQDNPGAHAWVDGAVQHWNQGSSNCVNGWRGTGASFDIGGDYRIGSNGLLGLAVNLQRSNGRVAPVDSKFNYSSYGATLYGSLYQNEAFYLDGQLGGSYTRSNVRRTVCLPNFTDCVESSLNGGRLQGRVEAGWVHKRASGGVQPYVAFEGEWARFGCFNEGCNSPVALSSWSSTSAHALFLGGGVRLFSVMEKDGWSLQPELDVAYAYNFTGSPYSTNISWVQAPSCCCFDGLNPVRNLVSLTAGAVAQIGQAWQIGLRFNGQVGTQHWNSLGGNLQVSYSF